MLPESLTGLARNYVDLLQAVNPALRAEKSLSRLQALLDEVVTMSQTDPIGALQHFAVWSQRNEADIIARCTSRTPEAAVYERMLDTIEQIRQSICSIIIPQSSHVDDCEEDGEEPDGYVPGEDEQDLPPLLTLTDATRTSSNNDHIGTLDSNEQKILAKLRMQPVRSAHVVQVIRDIKHGITKSYVIKWLKGNPTQFRVRYGKLRIIFDLATGTTKVIDIRFRKEVYDSSRN
jgi:mRNA-degrading endonuclease RelE of RelBE toxin-antitoxin system